MAAKTCGLVISLLTTSTWFNICEILYLMVFDATKNVILDQIFTFIWVKYHFIIFDSLIWLLKIFLFSEGILPISLPYFYLATVVATFISCLNVSSPRCWPWCSWSELVWWPRATPGHNSSTRSEALCPAHCFTAPASWHEWSPLPWTIQVSR